MTRIPVALLFFVLFMACNRPAPRKPVQQKSGSFFKESIERNRKLLEMEEAAMQEIIKRDSLKHYTHSNAGSWYHYLKVNDSSSYTPQARDVVYINYDLLSFTNDTIYSSAEIDTVRYVVDQEALFFGLREAVKILKEGEKATFLFPSSLGYGYHGDNDRIGANVPLKSTLTLHKIEKRNTNITNNDNEN